MVDNRYCRGMSYPVRVLVGWLVLCEEGGVWKAIEGLARIRPSADNNIEDHVQSYFFPSFLL
jgi:hypothetical protein